MGRRGGMDEMGEEGYTCRYTVTTRMTRALRWAAMRVIFINCAGGTKSVTTWDCSDHRPQLLKRKESRRGFELWPLHLPGLRLLPLGQTGSWGSPNWVQLFMRECCDCLKLHNTSDLPRSKPLVRIALPTSLNLLCHFRSLRHVQGSTPTEVFDGGWQPLTHSSLGFPLHLSVFVASSLNLWGWWHVWSDCQLLRQFSMGDCVHLHCGALVVHWVLKELSLGG